MERFLQILQEEFRASLDKTTHARYVTTNFLKPNILQKWQ